MLSQHDSACQVAVAQTLDDLYESYYQINDFEGSDDGDFESRPENIALRKAASIEAMQAYGGCFASGFFAMQDPLPWTKPPNTRRSRSQSRKLASDTNSVDNSSVRTSSTRSISNDGMPRPDSDTLSNADAHQLKSSRKWKWSTLVKNSKTSTKMEKR